MDFDEPHVHQRSLTTTAKASDDEFLYVSDVLRICQMVELSSQHGMAERSFGMLEKSTLHPVGNCREPSYTAIDDLHMLKFYVLPRT